MMLLRFRACATARDDEPVKTKNGLTRRQKPLTGALPGRVAQPIDPKVRVA
jgi:hypothetical protein